jgi:response regulator RpfG family c-di-GMP phosphodiesterase
VDDGNASSIHQQDNSRESTTLINKTVLFVDDEIGVLNTIRRLFRHADFRVLTATSGKEGLEVLAREDVRLVVSDQRMPLMSGAEFLAQVSEDYPSTIRMVMSGYADIEAVIDAVNQGKITHFLTKPWDTDDLKTTIENCLQGSKENDYTHIHMLVLELREEIDSLKAQARNDLPSESSTLSAEDHCAGEET